MSAPSIISVRRSDCRARRSAAAGGTSPSAASCPINTSSSPGPKERAAASLGVPVRQTKLRALMLSAAFTSVAGSLYSIKTGFVDPESGIGLLASVQMLITAALGAAGTLFGPLVGALILVPLQSATNTWFGGSGSGLTYILYGGIIVLIARFEPGGLFDLWNRLASRFRSSKAL